MAWPWLLDKTEYQLSKNYPVAFQVGDILKGLPRLLPNGLLESLFKLVAIHFVFASSSPSPVSLTPLRGKGHDN